MTSHDEFDETELQALREAAQKLSREVSPNPEAWANIRDRIEQTRVRELLPSVSADATAGSAGAASSNAARAPKPTRSWMQSTRGVALIAATLFLAVTTFVVQRQGAVDSGQTSPYAADTGRMDMTGVLARYDGAATDLVNDLDRRRALLNPATVAVLDSCLNTIDEAIRETRDALKDAPDNATIAELLEVTYQQKLDLLRRVSEMSEGSF